MRRKSITELYKGLPALQREVVTLRESLRWALAHVRMPNGVDPEEFAAKYNAANDLVKKDKTK